MNIEEKFARGASTKTYQRIDGEYRVNIFLGYNDDGQMSMVITELGKETLVKSSKLINVTLKRREDQKLALSFDLLDANYKSMFLVFCKDMIITCEKGGSQLAISNALVRWKYWKGIESACNKTKGKHIYLYETQSESRTKKGVIAEKAKENARWFISRAEIKLQQSPFTESEAVCSNLRHAIEAIIDEKIFNNQVPNKFSNKNARINWIELKNLNPDESIINRLNALHSRCSGGELHIGSEREENPVDKEELLMICEELTKFIE